MSAHRGKSEIAIIGSVRVGTALLTHCSHPQRFSSAPGSFLKADSASSGSYRPKRATETMVELDNGASKFWYSDCKLALLLGLIILVGLTDMEELVATVPEKDIASYIRGAMVCYGAGAYRGCIVLTHVALFEGSGPA